MLGWVGFAMSQVYMYGATGLWILPIPWQILCALIVWMVPQVRRPGAVSLLQALEQRFGRGVRPVLAVVSWAVFLAWIQAGLFAQRRIGFVVSPRCAACCDSSMAHPRGEQLRPCNYLHPNRERRMQEERPGFTALGGAPMPTARPWEPGPRPRHRRATSC